MQISETTKDIFVEITSSNSQAACKTVLQQLLLDTLELDIVESRDGFKFMKVIYPQKELQNVLFDMGLFYCYRCSRSKW